MRERERRGILILWWFSVCPGGQLWHQQRRTASAFPQLPVGPQFRGSTAPAGRSCAVLAATVQPSPCRSRSTVFGAAGDRREPMFNRRGSTALFGSTFANAIFRGGSGSSGSASQSSQWLVLEALRPLLSILLAVPQSMWPSPLERQMCLRLLVAASVGIFIGTERRTSHRPAGVRTMSLVALGACTFTLVSQYGFVGKADQARVAASVASGVGFIGAGVITTSGKEASIRESFSLRGGRGSREPSTYNDVDGEVRGLTTASAIWITAGLGMACGAGLISLSMLGAILTVGILKISEVITTVRKKWVWLRSKLRPKLAKKLAEEAEERVKAEKDGKTSGRDHDDEDNEEDDDGEGEEQENKQLQREKEKREEKRDKETKIKNEQEREKNEKEKREREKIKVEQQEKEKEKRLEAETLAGPAAGEAGSASGPGETVGMEDEEEEKGKRDVEDEVDFAGDDDYRPVHEREPEDVDYLDDPFYDRPWSTEAPKVPPTKDEEGNLIPVPAYGPARRRTLSRSRVLASTKDRLDQRAINRRRSDPAGSSPEAAEKPFAAVGPAGIPVRTTAVGGRTLAGPVLVRPVRTVGDLLLSEKLMDQRQQQRRLQQQQQQQQQQRRQKGEAPKNQPEPGELDQEEQEGARKGGDADAEVGSP